MKPDPLVGTSLAPAFTGGRGVGGVPVKQAKESAAWPSLLPFIPTQSPSRVNRGRSGDKWTRRRGRWLKMFSSEFSDQGGRQIEPSKPVTVLMILERWRGFCAAGQYAACGEINAVLSSRFLVVGLASWTFKAATMRDGIEAEAVLAFQRSTERNNDGEYTCESRQGLDGWRRQEARSTGETKHPDAGCSAKARSYSCSRSAEGEFRRDFAKADKSAALRHAQEVAAG